MISVPIEAMIRPIHQRDTVVIEDHRVRDELELYHNSTYQYVKDSICNDKRCGKFGGKCGPWCPAGELVRYARRDEERIGELMKELHEKDDTIAFLREHIKRLEETVEGYRATIIELRQEKAPLPF